MRGDNACLDTSWNQLNDVMVSACSCKLGIVFWCFCNDSQQGKQFRPCFCTGFQADSVFWQGTWYISDDSEGVSSA